MTSSTTTPSVYPSALSNAWKRSSHCSLDDCVEVRHDNGKVMLRHSKAPEGPVLTYSLDEWRAFVQGVQGHEFDA